jgi:hypothetical protein
VIAYNTNRRKEIRSKYLDKGILVEQDSVDLLCDVTGNFYDTETERKSDSFFTGECDLIFDDTIVDIKSSFDIFTFYEADFKDLYYWQGQVYMRLYDKQKFELAYCLVNMPEAMFNALNEKLKYKFGSDTHNEAYVKELNILINNSFFDERAIDEIPKKERVKIFTCERNDKDMDLLIERVKMARKYAIEWWNNRNLREKVAR